MKASVDSLVDCKKVSSAWNTSFLTLLGVSMSNMPGRVTKMNFLWWVCNVGSPIALKTAATVLAILPSKPFESKLSMMEN